MLFASSKDRREGEQYAKSYRKFSVKYQKGDQPMVSWKQNELREKGGKEKKVNKIKKRNPPSLSPSTHPFLLLKQIFFARKKRNSPYPCHTDFEGNNSYTNPKRISFTY